MLNKKYISGQILICFFIFFIFYFTSCRETKHEIDTSGISINISFSRFEKDLFSQPLPVTSSVVADLRNQYPDFFDLFCTRIIRIHAGDDSTTASNLNMFVTDHDIITIYKKTVQIFPDLDWLKEDLTEMLKHYSYYFPEKPVPGIVSYISAFNYTVITTDSLTGIGLDMYLGRDCEFYPGLGLPQYKISQLSKEYIVRDVIKALFQSDYDPDQVSNEFLSQIIYQGKLLYYTDLMAPGMEDTLKIGYTAEQVKWCFNNESNIWGFMIENNLLYSKEPSRYIRYINDGMTTPGLPKESPAKLGAWIGWKIVRAYMSKHPDLPLKGLLEEKDAQKILAESGYKPGK